jgi:hypothetical protein
VAFGRYSRDAIDFRPIYESTVHGLNANVLYVLCVPCPNANVLRSGTNPNVLQMSRIGRSNIDSLTIFIILQKSNRATCEVGHPVLLCSILQ